MSNSNKWIDQKVHQGWILLAAGLFTGLSGILLPWVMGDLAFNARIITGVGILLLGWGISNLVRYGSARRDALAARRLVIEEKDERMQMLRSRAGNLAYWVSSVFAYIGLMWLSFADNGGLPLPSVDSMWYYMAGLVIFPFIVYAISLAYFQANG